MKWAISLRTALLTLGLLTASAAMAVPTILPITHSDPMPSIPTATGQIFPTSA